jgi:hypothetical protein
MTQMKRRLVLFATAAALIGGGAGVASAGQHQVGAPTLKPGQTCLVFYHQDGSKPSYLCLNY